MLLGPVGGDAHDRGAGPGEGPEVVVELARLFRAARRVVGRVEVHDDRAAGEVAQRHLVAVLVGQGERGGLVAGGEARLVVVVCQRELLLVVGPPPWHSPGPPSSRARDSGPRELGGTGLRGRLAGADRRPDPGNAGGGRTAMTHHRSHRARSTAGGPAVTDDGADPATFNRRKVYVEGAAPGVRVPFVEVTLSPTPGRETVPNDARPPLRHLGARVRSPRRAGAVAPGVDHRARGRRRARGAGPDPA